MAMNTHIKNLAQEGVDPFTLSWLIDSNARNDMEGVRLALHRIWSKYQNNRNSISIKGELDCIAILASHPSQP